MTLDRNLQIVATFTVQPNCSIILGCSAWIKCPFKNGWSQGLKDKGDIYYGLVPMHEDYPIPHSDQITIVIIGYGVKHRRSVFLMV